MASTKEIQARIKSVTNTKKVTKAMEMVAAAKMRRAIEAVLKTRRYASLSWDTIERLSQAVYLDLITRIFLSLLFSVEAIINLKLSMEIASLVLGNLAK